MRGVRFFSAVLAGLLLAAGILADDELKLDQYRIGQVSSRHQRRQTPRSLSRRGRHNQPRWTSCRLVSVST